MSGLFIPLWLTPGAEYVYLRGICGADEMAVEETDTKNLINLLESLMEEGVRVNKIHATQIVTADRDRLLATLYTSLFGSRVQSTLSCKNCDQKFDLDFSLDELLSHYQPTPGQASESGAYECEPGISFRLPTGEDELLIDGYPREEAEMRLLERCLLKGNPVTDNEKVQLKMAEMAPVLNMEMQAICPECSQVQQVQFDMQSFFLTRLVQDRPGLIHEIHNIATQYHWSQQEILKLPRILRKQYSSLIQSGN